MIAHGLWGGNARFSRRDGETLLDLANGACNSEEAGFANAEHRGTDWHLASTPSKVRGWFSKYDLTAALLDFGLIRPQAQQVGESAAVRLILEKAIKQERPLHLIGHSAGGYAVARCAMLLNALNVVANPVHVTILDTPPLLNLPIAGSWRDEDLLKNLPDQFPGKVDFYKTSSLVQLPKNFSYPGMHYLQVDHPSEGLKRDHGFVVEWFIKTIEDENFAPDEGFNRSPLVKKN